MLKPRSRGLAATRDSNAIQINLAVLFIAQWPGPVAQDRLLYKILRTLARGVVSEGQDAPVQVCEVGAFVKLPLCQYA